MNNNDIIAIARKDMILTSMNNLLFDRGMISAREHNLILLKIKTFIEALPKTN